MGRLNRHPSYTPALGGNPPTRIADAIMPDGVAIAIPPVFEQRFLPCLRFGRAVFLQEIDELANARWPRSGCGKLLMRLLDLSVAILIEAFGLKRQDIRDDVVAIHSKR
jgi:hypothetical protein